MPIIKPANETLIHRKDKRDSMSKNLSIITPASQSAKICEMLYTSLE